jgi:hypothetical protein
MRILVTLLAVGLVLTSCEPPSEDPSTEAEASIDPGASDPDRRMSAVCTGTDQTPPQAVLTAPFPGATLSGTVTLTATASDDTGVVRVEFFLGSRLLGSDFTAPYELVWNSATVSNGAATLTARAYDAACNQGGSGAVDVTIQNAGNAAFEPSRGVPVCAAVGNKCDSVELLEGRGSVGPELHSPNTVGGSCADGSEGTYRSSPSLERFVVFRSDGTAFAVGKEVTVQATVYASTNYAQEALELYAAADANSPVWTLVGTLSPTSGGIQALSATYLLPAGGLQALRGVYRSGAGNGSACVPGPLNDHDDLLLAVGLETDSTPPSEVITSPAGGANVSGVVTVTAAASDNFGVQRVELYDGSTLVATDDRAPYSFTWDTQTAPNGSHPLTVRAYDVAGNGSTSAVVNVLVDNDHTPPQVSFTSPTDSATVNQTISLTASASDDRSVARVDFFVDGTFIGGKAGAAPYTVSWNTGTVSNGSHLLRATALDAAGNASAPSTVNILVDNDYTPPQTELTSPANGATVSNNVVLQATASDDRQVVRVEFLLDGLRYWTVTTPPYTEYWDTREVLNGSYTLTSRAYDAAGNSTTSAPVTVQVNNPGSARFDPVLGVPRCDTLATGCDSLMLLKGRNDVEQHTPNTLDGCRDGSIYSGYHDLESIERIQVTTTDNQPLSAGKRVYIDVEVWANSRGYAVDSLDLYYTADATHPSWTYLTTLRPSYYGTNWLSTTYTLPAGDLQAVRANFRAYGSVSPCSGGNSDDHDDLVFPVFTDATPPTVTLTAPASGATVSGTVLVTASVSDNGTVAAVDFYDGQTLIATDTYAPYSVSWATRSGPNGSHTLTARARDAAGNVGTSAPVTVTADNDFTAPTVSLSAPSAGATLVGTATISADATDDRAITRVDFYDGTRLLASNSALPFSYAWNTAAEATGPHTLSAKAYDAAGNVGTSAQVVVTVVRDTTPPSVSLTAPTDGATLMGSVTLSADATDDIGVSKVEFLLDGSLLATDTTAPYSSSWNTKSAANGSHTLSVRATDSSGNVATSATVSVTVDNDPIPPTVSIASPASGATVSGNVSVQVSATDNKAVSQVRFLVDGSLVNLSSTAPYVFTWVTTSLPNGTHTLTAGATDSSGNVATSAPITVTVYNDTLAPTVAIISPANGASLAGVVSLQVNATDDVGVTGVDFFANGYLLGSSTTPPFSLSWDTDQEANGSYTLSAKARDAAGHTTTSAYITVTINQPGRATFDNDRRVPKCATVGAGCDTMNLVTSRGFLSERNAPNTLDGTCADPSASSSSADEKINRIKLSRVGGEALEEGRPVRIDVDVVAASPSLDALDLFYTADAYRPAWIYLTTVVPSVSGAQTLSAQYTPPTGSLQAVRAQFRRGGSSSTACTGGTYDDHDDVIFAVGRPLDSAPPTVELTAPSNNVMVRGSVPFAATASDDVAVEHVEFYVDGSAVSMTYGPPYTTSWYSINATDGAHTVTAKAFDSSGHVGTSAPVSIIVDNTAPTTAISAPAQSAKVRGTVQITATASDNLGVARVEFYAGTTLIGTATTAPYSVNWDTTSTANGSNVTLTTRAYDAAGNVTPSADRVVTVDNAAPTVAITSPANGASLFLTATINVSASDNLGVTQVVFYDGSAVMGSDTSAPYSLSWNLLSAAKGNHTLTAKAYDAAGNITTSAPITVKVN